MSEYEAMLDCRKSMARTVEDDVVHGFLALSNEARDRVAVRIGAHFDNLGHSQAVRWHFVKETGDAA